MQKEPRNKDDRTALSFYFLLYYKERCLRVLGYGLYVLLELSTVFGDSSPNHLFYSVEPEAHKSRVCA